jgi:diguanylate cyclase (GGDEF)-like protein/hemerythrin-like metal-binding protein
MSAVRNLGPRLEDDQIGLRALGALLVNSRVIALALISEGRIVFANPAFHAEFDATESLAGVPLKDIVADVHMDRLGAALAAAEYAPTTYFGVDGRGLQITPDVKLDLEGAFLDGEPVVIAFASHIRERHQSDERLAYLAYTDMLTGVANRARFGDRLHQVLLSARRSGVEFAVLAMDLDGFKAVNDAYGHDAGDTVLQLAVQRFQGSIRDGDTLARLGGDEFAVLLPRLDGARSAVLVAQRLVDALKNLLDLGPLRVDVGVSIGIAAYPKHAMSVDALMAAADAALFGAKRAGKNQFQWAVGRSGLDASPVPLPSWNVTHSVGIEEIDGQHAHLADLVDVLSAALKDSADTAAIAASLQELVSYAEFHFATEERLMAEFGVPSVLSHRNAHRRLLEDIRNLDVDGDLPSISLILRYMREWLFRHIDGFDRDLGHALVAKGCQ